MRDSPALATPPIKVRIPVAKDPLPTPEEIGGVELAYREGWHELDRFIVSFNHRGLRSSDYWPQKTPSLELIGALYALADDVRGSADSALRVAGEIREAAYGAHLYRVELEAEKSL